MVARCRRQSATHQGSRRRLRPWLQSGQPGACDETDTPRFRIPQRVVLIDSFVSVPKIGLIRAIVHRPLSGVTKGATFKREACGHWYISLVVEQHIAPKVDRPVVSHIGIDVGL